MDALYNISKNLPKLYWYIFFLEFYCHSDALHKFWVNSLIWYVSLNIKGHNIKQRKRDLTKYIAFHCASFETKFTKLTYFVRIKSPSEHINNNSDSLYLLQFTKHFVIYDTILILNYVYLQRKTRMRYHIQQKNKRVL